MATPSGRRRFDGVEDDAMIQHERAVKFDFHTVRDPHIKILRLRAVADDEGPASLHRSYINIVVRGRTHAWRFSGDRWLPIQRR